MKDKNNIEKALKKLQTLQTQYDVESSYFANLFCINYLARYNLSNPNAYVVHLLKAYCWHLIDYDDAAKDEINKFLVQHKKYKNADYEQIYSAIKSAIIK